jgi:hypothetical protein
VKDLKEDIDNSFSSFTDAWHSEQAVVIAALRKSEAVFKNSYARLVSINLWRELLLNHTLDDESLAFFLEAQNDALVSHVFASQGAWRASLQSLRAFLESAVFCLYFKDHPVELELWSLGKYKPGFADTKQYISRHPRFLDIEPSVAGIDGLGDEYNTLSRAVHGGAPFRMTVLGNETLLWSAERASLGAWAAREKKAVAAINQVLLTMFSKELQGTALPLLRKALGFAIPSAMHLRIKKNLSITLYRP